jgi:hypothetical protein
LNTISLFRKIRVEADSARTCFGSNVPPAIRSVAASRPQEVYRPTCPSGTGRSFLVRMQPKHTFVRARIRMAGLLRNPRPTKGRDIPNGLLSISCLRLALTAMSGFTKSASSRVRDLCGRWSCSPSSSSYPAGVFKGASREFAAQNFARSIFWLFHAVPGTSAPAVKPNGPRSLPKSPPRRA